MWYWIKVRNALYLLSKLFAARLSKAVIWKVPIDLIVNYLTTKNTKIMKEKHNILIFPLRVLRALRGFI